MFPHLRDLQHFTNSFSDRLKECADTAYELSQLQTLCFISPAHSHFTPLPYSLIQSKITFHVCHQLFTLRSLKFISITVNCKLCVHANMYACVHAFMCVCVCAQRALSQYGYFSQLVCLAIKRHSIRLHMKAAGVAAAHPADRSAVERRPAPDSLLVHHCGFRLLFGLLRFWQLEFHELVGLFKAAKGHGAPTNAR